jgi:tetratricopeptide (TPR) repeat protein
MSLLTLDEEVQLGSLAQRPHRIYAEQVYSAYARARAESSEELQALALECEDALTRLLGRELVDPWPWQRLSDLYEAEGRAEQARDTCLLGLKRAPEDAGLLERLARTASVAGGPGAAVRALEAHMGARGASTSARWHLAVSRFYEALAGLRAEPRVLDSAHFEAAEAHFRTLGDELPELAEAALGYEVVARLARGWCALHAGDLSQATSLFLSLDELRDRGVEWSLPGELESGIQGLYLVADAYSAREDKLGAGEVFETLRRLQPGSYLWANNAGFFLRDAAFDLETQGRKLCRAARGRLTNAEALVELRGLAGLRDEAPGSPAEKAGFLRAANERLVQARALMERSWLAYRPAAELAPDDVRVVNDAALVLVYYLHHDLEWAEQALQRCVELGGPQIETKNAALALEEAPERAQALEDELNLLTEAWGDAHQNLGVLAWVHRKDAQAAERWLVKSLEIWPSRPPVTNSLLPQVRGELAPEEDDHWDLLHWAAPCTP